MSPIHYASFLNKILLMLLAWLVLLMLSMDGCPTTSITACFTGHVADGFASTLLRCCHAGFWHKHTLPLLQLAEVYLRCQHLSRVVGLESGQLLAAVVPTTTQQLLHVLSSRHLVTALAALVITRCKVLRVVLKDTLQRHNAADSEAGEPAPATANSGGGSGLLLAHQQQGGEHGTDGSDSSSARGNSRHSHCGSGIDNAGNPCSSDSDDDSVSISSWCSSSSSILESPGVQLHEEHLAVGGMALHMLEQAAAWLRM